MRNLYDNVMDNMQVAQPSEPNEVPPRSSVDAAATVMLRTERLRLERHGKLRGRRSKTAYGVDIRQGRRARAEAATRPSRFRDLKNLIEG